MKSITEYPTFESFQNEALSYDIRKEWTLGPSGREPNDNILFGFISALTPEIKKENAPKLELQKAWSYSEYDDQAVKEANFEYLYKYLKSL